MVEPRPCLLSIHRFLNSRLILNVRNESLKIYVRDNFQTEFCKEYKTNVLHKGMALKSIQALALYDETFSTSCHNVRYAFKLVSCPLRPLHPQEKLSPS